MITTKKLAIVKVMWTACTVTLLGVYCVLSKLYLVSSTINVIIYIIICESFSILLLLIVSLLLSCKFSMKPIVCI